MKRLLLFACACLLGMTGWSQTLTVYNFTSAPVAYIATAALPNSCQNQFITNTLVIPAGATYVVTAADFTTPMPPTFIFNYVRYYDPAYPSCGSGSPAGPCWYGVNHIGNANCPGAPQGSCFVGVTCGSQPGVVTNASWGVASPIDYAAKFYP